LAWIPWNRTAAADLVRRVRARVKCSRRSLGRKLQYVLDESAHASCCAEETVEGVKRLVCAAPPEPAPRDPEPGPM
jgi:hypothetical protein